jgi:predicted AAA+ superfamily ATPase
MLPSTQEDLRAINQKVLLMAHDLAIKDINEAAMVLNVTKDVAMAIAEIPKDKLINASRNARVLLHPSLLPAETWQKFRDVEDDYASVIPLLLPT